MTALQSILKEAKSLRKQYPKRYSKWTDYVKQASAIYASKHKGKSPVGKKKSAKKVGVVKHKKVAKKKISEQGILNRIHKVKHDVERLDEAQHKHMMSGLTKIIGKIYNKYYIQYMHENGYKCREYYNKYPTNRYVGVDGYIYVPKLTQGGTSLVALKHSKSDKQVKK
jgi:hypothetical protein